VRLSEILGKRRRQGPITRVPVVDQARGFWPAIEEIRKEIPDVSWTPEQLWNMTTRRLAAYANVPENHLRGVMTSSVGAGIASMMEHLLIYGIEGEALKHIVDRAIEATFHDPEDARTAIHQKRIAVATDDELLQMLHDD
jgi:hypothetical protein